MELLSTAIYKEEIELGGVTPIVLLSNLAFHGFKPMRGSTERL